MIVELEFLIGSLTQFIVASGLIGSALYCLVMLYSARQFFRQLARRRMNPQPGVTVLKPLKGLDADLYENLAGLCRQDYGTYQVVCGVADANDPAVAVVRRVQAEFPTTDLELVIDARLYGANHKVSNLHNMYPRAKHEVIVIADSDIRVSGGYLRGLVAHLDDPQVGLVTCLYRAVDTGGLPTLIESLFINTDWCHMVLVARVVERPTYAFGATIALRRVVLDEIGGFLPIADHLADDYQIGQRVVAHGYRCALAEQVVDTVIAVGSWRRLLQHQLRWARTYRICRPGGYFSSIMTHATLWAVLNLATQGLTMVSLAASGALLGLRYACAAILARSYLGWDASLAKLLLVVPKDLLISFVWLLAFGGDTVTWSGRRFRVRRDGRMTEVGTAMTPPIGTEAAWPQMDADPSPGSGGSFDRLRMILRQAQDEGD